MPLEENQINRVRLKRMLRNFAIEIVIYGALVILYYFLALRLLSSPLENLFREYLPAYAIVSLILITAQGVLLESLTSFLLKRLGLQRVE
jgi:hypothetical protein